MTLVSKRPSRLDRCLKCRHIRQHHIKGIGLCLVASCRMCLLFRPQLPDFSPSDLITDLNGPSEATP